ncbi:MAG: tyrosine-type recombinase/integrase [Desulfitobacterium hafniense]|nr:tyrosine-type recombinase/integrase [Desulfitobacterium hafniense]
MATMKDEQVTKTRSRSTFYYEGKRYEATGKSQKEADQKAAIKKDKLKRGEVGITGNMTVERWATEWLETYKMPVVGEGQYKNYLSHVKGVIIPAIGNLKLKDVKDIHLQKILNSRIGKSKYDLAKLRITIKAIFKKAYSSKLIFHNPAEDLELPAAEEGTHRKITDYEREKILTLAETHRAGLWIKTLLYTGMRPAETIALEWRHIDFDKQLIHVEQAVKAATNDIGAPKSKSGIRDIPIQAKLLPSLIKACGSPFEPVFIQPVTRKHHTKTSMRCWWNSFKRALNISMGAKLYRNKIIISAVAPDLTPYCLRHTFCTDLQDAGVPINMARYLMGHADISTTARIYTHTTEKAIQDAAKKMNAQ